MLTIRKAVFPVAGLGTRFLPATKAMPKELLPIVDKPLIQYAAEEAVSAGIDTLIFVTGRHKRAIEDHFDSNPELEATLKESGKFEQAEMVKNILPEGVKCVFVRQPVQLGLGDAILCAERVVGAEPFAVLLADDFIVAEQKNNLKDLMENYQKTQKSQISVKKVHGLELSKYGVLKLDKFGELQDIIEKPKIEAAPSNLASIGRYVLSPEIFSILKSQQVGLGNELQLSEAIGKLARSGKVKAIEINGAHFDCGSKKGMLEAIFYFAKLENKL